jgi:NAD(P)-dependent dehydrogenase (short-subunit alcohol dehydrogenase family)
MESGQVGRVALVTGASSGIGAAIVRRFAAAGYRVLASGRDRGRLAAVAAGLGQVACETADLSADTAATCTSLVDRCMARFGALHVLVNTAGIYVRRATEATTDEDWRRTLTVNLDAPFFLSRAALPHLRARRGCILNIASDWGIRGGRDAAAYCASKGGLVLMSRAMALDHAREGIRVNAICPGDVDTPMLEQEAAVDGLDHAAALRQYGAMSPSGRVTTADEVAAMALYLASDEAVQVTGAAIPIDGGSSA